MRARARAPLRLEARFQRLCRGTLVFGQPGAVAGELGELHVEVRGAAQGTQHGFGGLARSARAPWELAFEQTGASASMRRR